MRRGASSVENSVSRSTLAKSRGTPPNRAALPGVRAMRATLSTLGMNKSAAVTKSSRTDNPRYCTGQCGNKVLSAEK